MTITPLLLTLLLFFSFTTGITATLLVFMLIERRVLGRPGARVEVARRMLDGGAS